MVRAEEQLEKIKTAVDNMDMKRLWKLALADPAGFFGKLSVRMLGKKRIQALHHYLLGVEASGETFSTLLKTKVENELGIGLFAKKKGK